MPNSSTKSLIQQGLAGEHSEIVNQYRDILPNFIIIGAAKSATTTLATILPQHPDIFISKPKEPKFFGRYYKQGWSWYASRFKQGKNFPLRGEASTMYTSKMKGFKNTPELMYRYLPKIKLIYIVRDPLDRIVSQWRHYRGRHPDCADFTELTRNRHMRRLILGCSMYFQRISKFREYYPDEQIHCMTFEDLLNNPENSLKKTLKFLGTEPKIVQMLDHRGKIPRINEAGAKGREYIDKPIWGDKLKSKVLRRIKPDAEQMLAYMGKPLDYWNL